MLKSMIYLMAASLITLTGCAYDQHAPSADAAPAGMKLVFAEDFESGADRWEPTDPTNWALHANGDGQAWGLERRRSDYKPEVRSPHNIALIKDLELSSFVMTLNVKSTKDTGNHRDACFFFNHQNAKQFYYVHMGALPDPRSGQIMLVDNAPRKAITDNQNQTPWTDDWHTVKIARDAEAGTITIYFDDMTKPHMQVTDKTFAEPGRIGIGSFDDMNDYDNIRIYAPE